MGLYYHSLDEVKPGMTVVVPSDPPNQARALVLLQQVGWITLKPNMDPIQVIKS